MTVIGTKLYIFGGQNGDEFTNDVIVFDIPSSACSALVFSCFSHTDLWTLILLTDNPHLFVFCSISLYDPRL